MIKFQTQSYAVQSPQSEQIWANGCDLELDKKNKKSFWEAPFAPSFSKFPNCPQTTGDWGIQ